MTSALKQTALIEEHRRLGGRLIDFGGWELPVQYSGVADEHQACREAAGLFDVSHMGEFFVEGAEATAFLDWLVTNRVAPMALGQAIYTVMCREDGGIVDDLVIYRRGTDRYLAVVNASNTAKDWAWFSSCAERFKKAKAGADLRLTEASAQFSQIALQGRLAQQILSGLVDVDVANIGTYRFAEGKFNSTIPALIARTGYTGEDGFELYVPWEKGPEVWRTLLEKGLPLGLKPCGLGARDTLRMEMKYPLYGNELSDETHPLEAGLGWVTKLDKDDFIGKTALSAAKAKGLSRKLVGLKPLDRGILRHGYPIFDAAGKEQIGFVTSGTQSPSLKQAVGIGYVRSAESALGSRLQVEIRGQKIEAEVIATPFYKRPY